MAHVSASRNLTKLVAQFLELWKHTTSFESALKGARLVSVEPGKVSFEFDVQKEHANRNGLMHGAFAALLVDNLTGAAIATTDKALRPENPLFSGVSVAMSLSYLSAAPVGVTIVAKAEVLKIGKTLAFTACEITHKTDGQVVATGQHTKFVG